MKNKLKDLNDHLFATLERLNDEDLDAEKIQLEVSRAKAITGVASQIISTHNSALETIKTMDKLGFSVYNSEPMNLISGKVSKDEVGKETH